MNNKGFTLVELVSAIVVLAVILMIAVPAVNQASRQARENAYFQQIDFIEKAAKKWGVENDSNLPQLNSNEIITVDFNTLYTLNYLKEAKIINPITEEELTGCVKVSYDSEYNQYKYQYIDDLTECDHYNINNK